MLDCKYFEFACPPYVGGQWVVQALARARLFTYQPIKSWHQAKQPWKNLSSPVLWISLVQHPLSWLYNWYASPMASKERFPEFRDYAAFVLEKEPRRLTNLLRGYPADCFLRREDLPQALETLLESFGIAPPNIPPPSRLYVPRHYLTEAQWEKLRETERELFERFDYF